MWVSTKDILYMKSRAVLLSYVRCYCLSYYGYYISRSYFECLLALLVLGDIMYSFIYSTIYDMYVCQYFVILFCDIMSMSLWRSTYCFSMLTLCFSECGTQIDTRRK
jgi:hypothetical protein